MHTYIDMYVCIYIYIYIYIYIWPTLGLVGERLPELRGLGALRAEAPPGLADPDVLHIYIYIYIYIVVYG